MGIFVQPAVRGGDAHAVQRVRRAAAQVAAVAVMRAHRLLDLRADGVGRVQAGHRLLEDHRDPLAAQRPHGAGGQREHILSVEHHLPGGGAARRGHQAHDGQRQHGLAAAALPHDAERRPAVDAEAHAVHGGEGRARAGKLGAQAPRSAAGRSGPDDPARSATARRPGRTTRRRRAPASGCSAAWRPWWRRAVRARTSGGSTKASRTQSRRRTACHTIAAKNGTVTRLKYFAHPERLPRHHQRDRGEADRVRPDVACAADSRPGPPDRARWRRGPAPWWCCRPCRTYPDAPASRGGRRSAGRPSAPRQGRSRAARKATAPPTRPGSSPRRPCAGPG